MTSAIGWIDFDEAERQRAQRLLQMFTEQESRDELGLGAIRDSIADHLFPGTSTIQTRLRYMLFIPWIYARLPARSGAREAAEQARRDQISLRDALVAGGETIGIIGRDAGPKLKRLPASVYWAGLENWGIRQFPGSAEAYAAALPRLQPSAAKDHGDDDHDAAARAQRPWHPRLPESPDGLLRSATFTLTEEEAGFIVDRLIDRHPGSLLTFLAKGRDRADAESIWAHPHAADFPPAARRLVAHAEIFSGAMHGAALLYNLMLSELRGNEDWIEHYGAELAGWRASFDRARLRGWSLDAFWDEIRHPEHQVRGPARKFVEEWVGLIQATQALRVNRKAADALVRAREQRLKTASSRFGNRAARDRWQGSSGAYRLQFRWPQARRHLQDLTGG